MNKLLRKCRLREWRIATIWALVGKHGLDTSVFIGHKPTARLSLSLSPARLHEGQTKKAKTNQNEGGQFILEGWQFVFVYDDGSFSGSTTLRRHWWGRRVPWRSTVSFSSTATLAHLFREGRFLSVFEKHLENHIKKNIKGKINVRKNDGLEN